MRSAGYGVSTKGASPTATTSHPCSPPQPQPGAHAEGPAVNPLGGPRWSPPEHSAAPRRVPESSRAFRTALLAAAPMWRVGPGRRVWGSPVQVPQCGESRAALSFPGACLASPRSPPRPGTWSALGGGARVSATVASPGLRNHCIIERGLGGDAPSLPRASGNVFGGPGLQSCTPLPLAGPGTARHRQGADCPGGSLCPPPEGLRAAFDSGVCPSLLGPLRLALHASGCSLRARREGSRAGLALRVSPRPGGAATPAWPLEVARLSSGATRPRRFSTRTSSTFPKHTEVPAPRRLRASPSFPELGRAAGLQPVPGNPRPREQPRSDSGPHNASLSWQLGPRSRRAKAGGGGSQGQGEARGPRTWPQAERPGHQEAPGQVHGARRGGGCPVRSGVGGGEPERQPPRRGASSLQCARAPGSLTARSFGGSGRAARRGGAPDATRSGSGPVSAPLPPGQAAGCGLDAVSKSLLLPPPHLCLRRKPQNRSWEPRPPLNTSLYPITTKFSLFRKSGLYAISQKKEPRKAEGVTRGQRL